jgi:hypothetical protein
MSIGMSVGMSVEHDGRVDRRSRRIRWVREQGPRGKLIGPAELGSNGSNGHIAVGAEQLLLPPLALLLLPLLRLLLELEPLVERLLLPAQLPQPVRHVSLVPLQVHRCRPAQKPWGHHFQTARPLLR